MKPNVIILVLDTLRKDYAGGLEALRKQDFISFENAVATSSWTLPSHVSMFTGLLPHQHGVHEGSGVYIRSVGRLKAEMEKLSDACLLTKLGKLGYTTYGLTANPLISPYLGFNFDYYQSYGAWGNTTNDFGNIWNDKSHLSKGISILASRKFRLLMKLTMYDQIQRNLGRISGRRPMEKGSKHILNELKQIKFKEPFLLFVNMMEAHPPYTWDERSSSSIQFDSITQRGCESEANWKSIYGQHSELAVSRGVEAVNALERFADTSVTIVASDHGQLLGENGRYDHGFFLDDVLVNVPLFARFPKSTNPPLMVGDYVSLSEIPRLVSHSVTGEKTRLGGEYAISESFGPIWDFTGFPKSNEDSAKISVANASRVKIFSKTGTGVLNLVTGVFEELTGSVPNGVIDSLEMKKTDETGLRAALNQDDERILLENLRRLGYS